MKNILFLITVTIFVVSVITGCSKDRDGGEETGNKIQMTLDKAEYYPFDVVMVQLSETYTTEEYKGFVDVKEVKVQRISESQLAVALPDLTAGEYKLSLIVGDTKAENKLKVKAYPTVEDPEAVIAEIKTNFTGMVAEFKGNDSPNTALLESLVSVLNENLSQMSDIEQQHFAAYYKMHQEWEDIFSGSMERRTKVSARMEEVVANTFKWAASTAGFKACLILLATCASTYYMFPSAWTSGAVIISAAATLISCYLCERYGKKSITSVSFEDALNINGEWTQLKDAATNYDYILKNGDALSFNVQMRYRSVAARDIGNAAAPSVAKEMIATDDLFQECYNEFAGYINKLRSYISTIEEPVNSLQKISSISSPLTETEDYDDWRLVIVSGNVSAVKQTDNSYKFTTTAEDDVEFIFKITTENIESRAYTALLNVEESPIVGKWRHTRSVYIIDDGNPRTLEEPGIGVYTFTADGLVTRSPSSSFPKITYDSQGLHFWYPIDTISITWQLVSKTETTLVFGYFDNTMQDEYFYFERIND